jgi:hypothetical protein
MYELADSLRTATRILPWRSRLTACLLTLAVTVGTMLAAAPALASYPGDAGAIAFQQFSGSIDANGVETDDYALRFRRPPRGRIATGVSCQVVNLSDFGGNGIQYCPLFGHGYAPGGGPSYSPDGRSLVFSGAQYQNDGTRTPALSGCLGLGSCEAIILAAANTSNPRLLPVAIADAAQPAFMPDGKTLIFAGKNNPSAAYDLYTVATDGSALNRLTSNGASEPAPCANGSIVYVHDDQLYLRRANGRTRRLTRRGGTLPDCSHDSRTIAFIRHGALYTISASGERLRRLTRPNTTVDGRPAFSPAGGQIAITTTNAPACVNFNTAQTIYSLKLINLRGRVRHSTVIDREYCAEPSPAGLGTAGWQPLPTTTTSELGRRR